MIKLSLRVYFTSVIYIEYITNLTCIIGTSSFLPMWILQTRQYCQLIQNNIQKFCFRFELGLALCKDRNIPYIVTQFLLAHLVCLRLSISSAILEIQSRVWVDKGRRGDGRGLVEEGERPEGLGVGQCILNTGYGSWAINKVDFKGWHVLLDIQQRFLFQNTSLQKHLGRYFDAGDLQIKELEVIRQVLSAPILDGKPCLESFNIQDSVTDRRLQQRLLLAWGFVWRILVLSFHSEVMKLGGDYDELLLSRYQKLPAKYRTFGGEVLHRLFQDETGSSQDGELLDKFVLVKWIRAQRGGRAGRTVETDILHLWDFDDGKKRVKWANKPYRILFQKVIAFIKEFHGDLFVFQFKKGFFCYFLSRTHIWPAITTEKWWSYDLNHNRKWFGVLSEDNRHEWYLQHNTTMRARPIHLPVSTLRKQDKLQCLGDPLAEYEGWDNDTIVEIVGTRPNRPLPTIHTPIVEKQALQVLKMVDSGSYLFRDL